MSIVDRYAIAASTDVAVPAETAFEFMADGMKQDHWALGSKGREDLGDGLYRGKSSFSGTDLYIKITSDRELLLVDYATGPSPEELGPDVEARVRPGSWIGLEGGDGACVVTLTIWRWPGASEEEWDFHWHLWRTEMQLIKGAIERGL